MLLPLGVMTLCTKSSNSRSVHSISQRHTAHITLDSADQET